MAGKDPTIHVRGGLWTKAFNGSQSNTVLSTTHTTIFGPSVRLLYPSVPPGHGESVRVFAVTILILANVFVLFSVWRSGKVEKAARDAANYFVLRSHRKAKHPSLSRSCASYPTHLLPSTKVDLPVFTIHGNHDDPTRDGGPELLSAVDLLSVSNLVNYFGRQDEVDNVKVSPILLQKGETRVALYGLGSMRDERLNRMWQGKKVKFLRPDGSEGGDGDGAESEWFNIFALHQNRADTGRGSKNCVHESMIPEWMDLVVWGHEHECNITPQESLVGTFRITQPGSSVATALTKGESERKHVGLLEVRGQQFRLKTIPLASVRSFKMHDISLEEKARENGGILDPEDPKVEERISDVLAAEVDHLVSALFDILVDEVMSLVR